LLSFYEFAEAIEKVFPKLLGALFGSAQLDTNLKGQQALAKQLADILDFVLRFDDAKMINPGIQNDFSYYRRTLSKLKGKVEVKIRDELANKMSLFFAYPTPTMKMITDSTKALVTAGQIQKDQVIAGFSLMANVCLDMVEKTKFSNPKTNMFCLRAMTGSIVIVDHIDDLGAFCKKSTINIKSAVTALKNFTAVSTDSLQNALRFSTKHFNDADTPTVIKNLLA